MSSTKHNTQYIPIGTYRIYIIIVRNPKTTVVYLPECHVFVRRFQFPTPFQRVQIEKQKQNKKKKALNKNTLLAFRNEPSFGSVLMIIIVFRPHPNQFGVKDSY